MSPGINVSLNTVSSPGQSNSNAQSLTLLSCQLICSGFTEISEYVLELYWISHSFTFTEHCQLQVSIRQVLSGDSPGCVLFKTTQNKGMKGLDLTSNCLEKGELDQMNSRVPFTDKPGHQHRGMSFACTASQSRALFIYIIYHLFA